MEKYRGPEKQYPKIERNITKEYVINIMGKSLTLTYACLSLCKLFIGNDSGLMQCLVGSLVFQRNTGKVTYFSHSSSFERGCSDNILYLKEQLLSFLH